MRNHAIGATKRLTNICFADDPALYAKSCGELTTTITFLKRELSKNGLQLNADKTELFTTSSLESPRYIDVDDEMLEMLFANRKHRYLGQFFSGNANWRAAVEFARQMPMLRGESS